jgi:Uri superfamily endonuclease
MLDAVATAVTAVAVAAGAAAACIMRVKVYTIGYQSSRWGAQQLFCSKAIEAMSTRKCCKCKAQAVIAEHTSKENTGCSDSNTKRDTIIICVGV